MRVQDHSILTQLMSKYMEVKMNNKGALNEYASGRFNVLRRKECFEYEKLVGKKLMWVFSLQ